MKKFGILGMVAVLLISFSSFAFAGAQDFTLVNNSGVDIHYVFISPHHSNDWGADVMGKDTLLNGNSVDITFSPGDKATFWDIRVEDQAGKYLEWENFNLKEISNIKLKSNAMAEYQ